MSKCDRCAGGRGPARHKLVVVSANIASEVDAAFKLVRPEPTTLQTPGSHHSEPDPGEPDHRKSDFRESNDSN
jgi:hypothetical protein